MRDLWNIRAEITVEPQDFPTGATAGFMNIVTWAVSAEEAEAKIANYFSTFNWQIVEVCEAGLIDFNFLYESEEFQDMVDRALGNPDAIILGTFRSYRTN